MRKQQLSKYVMMVAILLIAAFQAYWLRSLYTQEWASLKTQANVLLKQSLQDIEDAKFKNDSNFIKWKGGVGFEEKPSILISPKPLKTNEKKQKNKPEAAIFFNPSSQKTIDTLKKVVIRSFKNDSAFFIGSTKDIAGLINDSLNSFINPNNIRNIHIIKDTGTRRIEGNGAIIINSKLSYVSSNSRDSMRKLLRQKDINYDTSFTTTNGYKITTSFKTKDTNYSKNFGTIILKLFNDTIPVKKVDSVFKLTLKKDKLNIGYTLIAKKTNNDSLDSVPKTSLATNVATVSPFNNNGFQVHFKNPFWYIVGKLKLPIAFSALLLLIVSAAFIFLYRNMMAQQRLTLMKNDFISNITHELKTPIATVNVAIEALRNFNALNNAQKTKEYLEISAAEINRLSSLVEKVLKLSMFENDKIDLVKEEVNVVMLLKECLSSMRLQFEAKQAEVNFNVDYDSIIIKADSLHLSSVFLNLMDNALKYSQQPLQLTINMQQNQSELVVEFIDNGMGISKAEQPKIFQKFYRVNHGVDRHNVKGYGLGLSYVHYIIKKHAGTITVNSDLQKGSCFTITLPIKDI